MPIALDTLRDVWLACMFHDMFDYRIRPKKLNWVTLSIDFPSSVTLLSILQNNVVSSAYNHYHIKYIINQW